MIALDENDSNKISTNVRVLSDGGYLIEIGGTSYVAYLASKPDASTGLRMNVGGKNIIFSPDYDPTALRTDVAGKLVKKLKPDNSYVKKGEPYCEIEVMKMFMPLRVEESGILKWCMNEGASIGAGDLLASIELDNPDNVAKVTLFNGTLTIPGASKTGISTAEVTPHLVLRTAMDKLDSVMSGYLLCDNEIDALFSSLASTVTRPYLPVVEVREQMSVLSGRIPPSLSESIMQCLGDFSNQCDMQAGSGVELR
jgi:acetyl-CoA carboxylase/biotin carboxylase 1